MYVYCLTVTSSGTDLLGALKATEPAITTCLKPGRYLHFTFFLSGSFQHFSSNFKALEVPSLHLLRFLFPVCITQPHGHRRSSYLSVTHRVWTPSSWSYLSKLCTLFLASSSQPEHIFAACRGTSQLEAVTSSPLPFPPPRREPLRHHSPTPCHVALRSSMQLGGSC